MTRANKISVNFSGGEVSPEVLARADLPIASKVVSRMQNFIATPQGPARFRNGFVNVRHTRRFNHAVFLEFQFNDVQSYLIEATDRYFRFYKTGGIILESSKTITGATQANPGVFTSVGHGYSTGDEIDLSTFVGMTDVNGKSYLVVKINADTFSLQDLYGNTIDTTHYGAYVSGGIAERVYELQVIYQDAFLETLEYTQNADTMYIVNQAYEPRKLTRTSDTSWTLAKYVRTSEPFVAAIAITGATAANPGVITAVTHGRSVNDKVYIEGVVGMTQLNNNHYLVNTVPTANTLTLKTLAGVVVDTSAYTAYSSGGTIEQVEGRSFPGAVGFTDDARLCMAGTLNAPETLWFSRGPSAAGAVRFDDFTTGTNADDALIFTLAPLRGKVDAIRWISNTDKYIAVGTFGSVRRMYGASEAEPLTPTGVNAKPANSDGVERTPPILEGSSLMYIQRGGFSLQSLEYDYTIDGYTPDDKNLVTDHLSEIGMKQVVRQVATPVVIWVVRDDGVLLGLTYKGKENIAGWHQHHIGGTDAVVERIGIMPRESNKEQIWAIIKRTINGQTVRHVEYMADKPIYPRLLDFFTEESASAADLERYQNRMFEIQKQAIHLDGCATYDGSVYGTNASASITMGQDADIIDAEDITVTASAAVFTSAMVGRQIWGAYTAEGIGGGRLEITGYTSTTVVTGTIIDSFPATATYDAGDWYITATEVSGLDYLEGETVGIIADGAVPDLEVVENGSITIDEPASVIHAGLQYLGILQTFPLDQGGVTGGAQNKLKNVVEVGIRFVNSGGVKFGTDPYHLQEISNRRTSDFTGRPIPLTNGTQNLLYSDDWTEDKALVIVQENPLPCIIAALDIFTETTDE